MMGMMSLLTVVSLTSLILCNVVTPFVSPSLLHITPHSTSSTISTLFSGKGIAPHYTWQEEAFEIEVTVKVPKETRAKDILFKASPTSVDLRLKKNGPEDYVVLLDPSRPLRGKVVLDGTFWEIGDPDVSAEPHDGEGPFRVVTVTIEKQIRTPLDDFDVVEYDWKGVYTNDDEEVSFRKYDEPEELNIREYAASLGVDIDNLNMSLVDKTMFTSGMNLTKSSLDSLREAGLIKEVTQQGDGSEWITDDNGEQVPFSSMGRTVSNDEMIPPVRDQHPGAANSPGKSRKIPFIDTDSPWNKAISVEDKENFSNEDLETALSTTETGREVIAVKKKIQKQREKDAVDPIATLTVARLREVLKARGLKVSGKKRELQDRLRSEVQTMMDSDEESFDETMRDGDRP